MLTDKLVPCVALLVGCAKIFKKGGKIEKDNPQMCRSCKDSAFRAFMKVLRGEASIRSIDNIRVAKGFMFGMDPNIIEVFATHAARVDDDAWIAWWKKNGIGPEHSEKYPSFKAFFDKVVSRYAELQPRAFESATAKLEEIATVVVEQPKAKAEPPPQAPEAQPAPVIETPTAVPAPPMPSPAPEPTSPEPAAVVVPEPESSESGKRPAKKLKRAKKSDAPAPSSRGAEVTIEQQIAADQAALDAQIAADQAALEG